PSAWIGPARTTRGRSGLIGKISFGKGNPSRVPLFPSLSGTAAIIDPGLRRVILFGAMATLVTGAFGCIGSWVVRGLLADGERPVVYDLGDDPWRMRMIAGDDVASRVTLVRGDIADRDALIGVVREHGIRTIIHLAAWQVPLCRQDPAKG